MGLPHKLITLFLLAGAVRMFATAPADTLNVPAVRDLREVSVSASPRSPLRVSRDGALVIGGDILAETPGIGGSADPVSLMRTMPSVSTTAELRAAMPVRGGGNGDNLFEADGVRIINPMHLLGLYSTFNPAYYRTYGFRADRVPAYVPDLTSGYVTASSGTAPDSVLSLSASVGLIESHGALSVPLGRRGATVSVGVRQTYLGLLFPDILTLGTSRLSYGFTDVNASVCALSGVSDTLRATFVYSRDRMGVHDANKGVKTGRFGWRNLAGGVEWSRRSLKTMLSVSRYDNIFEMDEGGRALDLPSSMTQLAGRTEWRTGDFVIGGEVTLRHTSGQSNRADASPRADRSARSIEIVPSVTWARSLTSRLDVSLGVRPALYGTPGWWRFAPQPRVSASYRLSRAVSAYAAYGWYVRFDRLIEESTGSLPADYWLCSGERVPQASVHSFSAGLSGLVPRIGVSWLVEGYYRRVGGVIEYGGSLLDLVNSGYDPTDHLLTGDGYAAGVSVMLMRRFGAVRGRVAYNYGVSRAKFDRYGDRTFPSLYDRPHDLTATVSWNPISPVTLSATYTYATGTPYTRAKYGYMIGENLICEYFDHNSSRLPAYNRLDLAATWRIGTWGRTSHRLNLSVYNATASRNILFLYTSYSLDDGITQRRSVMSSVIPSLTYTIEL